MSRREKLRSATSSQHAALDRIVAEQKNFTDLDGYVRWLRAMYRFHRDMEQEVDGWCAHPLIPCDPLRRRTALLSQDLSDLKSPVPTQEPRPLSPSTWAEALGMLYVTEGASLGARLLFVQAKKLGLSEMFGARQLGFAASNLESWRQLLQLLEDFDGAPEDEVKMIHSAQRTFLAASEHLSRQA